jgi:hypothetical protein
MPKISIDQIRTANQKLMTGKAGSVKPYSDKLSQHDINEMLKKAFHSIPQ